MVSASSGLDEPTAAARRQNGGTELARVHPKRVCGKRCGGVAARAELIPNCGINCFVFVLWFAVGGVDGLERLGRINPLLQWCFDVSRIRPTLPATEDFDNPILDAGC